MARFRGATKTCQECGNVFKVPPSRAQTARFCSTTCADKHRGPQGETVVGRCVACGSEFNTFASHLHRRKFCSVECKEASAAYRQAISRRTRGSGNGNWHGGRVRHSNGYVYVSAPFHPFASNGYVFEHRLVMEQWLRDNDPNSWFLITLGMHRYLSPTFVVHHKDENKANNAIENLECMTAAEHSDLHNALHNRKRE